MSTLSLPHRYLSRYALQPTPANIAQAAQSAYARIFRNRSTSLLPFIPRSGKSPSPAQKLSLTRRQSNYSSSYLSCSTRPRSRFNGTFAYGGTLSKRTTSSSVKAGKDTSTTGVSGIGGTAGSAGSGPSRSARHGSMTATTTCTCPTRQSCLSRRKARLHLLNRCTGAMRRTRIRQG